MKSPITTHVLDTAKGGPAAGVRITLERLNEGVFEVLSDGVTDDDGRVADLLAPGTLETGTYRITFFVGAYHETQGTPGFYPEVPVRFEIRATDEHYHVPLLISPFGFSTYRGS